MPATLEAPHTRRAFVAALIASALVAGVPLPVRVEPKPPAQTFQYVMTWAYDPTTKTVTLNGSPWKVVSPTLAGAEASEGTAAGSPLQARPAAAREG